MLITAEAEAGLGDLVAAAQAKAGGRPVPVAVVERDDLDAALAKDSVHQGIAVLAEPFEPLTVDDVVRVADGRDSAVVVVLDQVTDPHNVGAVLRSAAAFGAIAVIIQNRHAPEETGALAKAASGGVEVVPIARAVNLARALDTLKDAGFWAVGLAADASDTLAAAGLNGRVALVLGSEGEGLRRLVRERCDRLVRLPMTDAVDSLNVSAAAAIALYELVARQPSHPDPLTPTPLPQGERG